MVCGKRIGGTNLNRIRSSVPNCFVRNYVRFSLLSRRFSVFPSLSQRDRGTLGRGGWRTKLVERASWCWASTSLLLLAAWRASGRPKFTTLQILECNLEISRASRGISRRRGNIVVKICANVCYRFLFFLFFFPDKFEIDGTTIKDTANFYL